MIRNVKSMVENTNSCVVTFYRGIKKAALSTGLGWGLLQGPSCQASNWITLWKADKPSLYTNGSLSYLFQKTVPLLAIFTRTYFIKLLRVSPPWHNTCTHLPNDIVLVCSLTAEI